MEWQTDLCALFENTADGVWISGPEGRILFWNRAAEDILGYPAQQVVGQLCRELFGGCDGKGNRICGWPCPIKTLLHQGDLVQHFDMATRTNTGNPVWLDVSCITVPGNSEQPPTVVHLFRDVTAAHQIEVLVRQQLAQGTFATGEADAILNDGELTQRELQVITLMRAGATTAAIADQLFISKATVRNHIQNIFSKLGVHTRLEAVAHVNQATTGGLGSRTEAGAARGLTKETVKREESGGRNDRGPRSEPMAPGTPMPSRTPGAQSWQPPWARASSAPTPTPLRSPAAPPAPAPAAAHRAESADASDAPRHARAAQGADDTGENGVRDIPGRRQVALTLPVRPASLKTRGR